VIAICGLFGQRNLGNDCTLEAMLHNAQRYRPGTQITCICSGPDEIAARHLIPVFPFSRSPSRLARALMGWRTPLARMLRKLLLGIPTELAHCVRAFRALRGVDMLVIPGTGFLCDAYTGPFGWPYEILKWSVLAKARGCRLMYVSVGAGPLYHPLSRWFVKLALALADFRSYRDRSTRRYLSSIGANVATDDVYPDLAFTLPRPVHGHPGNGNGTRRVVGIGVMSYRGELSADRWMGDIYAEYLPKVAAFTNWLLVCGYDVRLLIGDLTYDGPVKDDFKRLLHEHATARWTGRLIDEPVRSVAELLSQIASTDLVVATRFHNVLLSLFLGKPAIALSFHHKSTSLMEDMGLSEYCQDLHTLTVDNLIDRFRILEKNHLQLKALITQKTAEFRRTLERQYASIFTS
jgi:polysaccharide pyruvyl transferase WcaK-like protein